MMYGWLAVVILAFTAYWPAALLLSLFFISMEQ